MSGWNEATQWLPLGMDRTYQHEELGVFVISLKALFPGHAHREFPGLRTGTFYMAEVEGEPVGCGGWTAEEPGTCRLEPGTAHLRHFAVAANWNGCGIGRALYDRCQADARNIGIQRFVCYASLSGEAFYAALGFRVVGAIEVSMGNQLAFPSIRMTREI